MKPGAGALTSDEKISLELLGSPVLSLTAKVRDLQQRFKALEHRFTAMENRVTAMEARPLRLRQEIPALPRRV